MLNKIKNYIESNGRSKISILLCKCEDLKKELTLLENENIKVINIGKELSKFIKNNSQSKHINIEIQDFITRIIDKSNSSKENSSNFKIAIYNLGILLEPKFELNFTQILKEISKSIEILIIWDSQMEIAGLLHWSTLKEKYHFNLSDIFKNNN